MDLLVNRIRDTDGYGDMLFVNGTTPITDEFVDAVAQRVFIMLRTFESEWYLNDVTGVPYLTRILGFKVEKSTVDRILQQKILQESGVADILEFSSTLSRERVYEARMKIRTIGGGTFTEILALER